jgi:hypothetical protein
MILLLLAAAFPVHACNSGSVRDAGFSAKRDMHRLCVFTDGANPEGDADVARLRSWFEGAGKYLNVTLERVDASDAAAHWTDYGIPSRPPYVPVVALVGWMPSSPRRAFVIDHWAPAPNDAELAALLASPARDAVKRAITDVWAVILYSPGATAEESKERLLNSLVQQWAAEHPPGIAIVSLDRKDPRERLLRSFVGLEPTGPDWAGVVFGRGKLMAPPFEGENITEANLKQLLTSLTIPCTCLQQSMTPGLDLPMTWEPEFDAKAAGAVQSLGYSETAVGGTTPKASPAPRAQEVPREDPHVLAAALLPLAAVLAIAAATVAAIIWRRRRMNS